MNSDRVIFDIKCVSLGLPPLSMGVASAYKMIKKMPAQERRKIMRKVRKIAKIEIRRRADRQSSQARKLAIKSVMERSTNLRKVKKKHDPRYILNRLRIAIDYVDYTARDS